MLLYLGGTGILVLSISFDWHDCLMNRHILAAKKETVILRVITQWIFGVL